MCKIKTTADYNGGTQYELLMAIQGLGYNIVTCGECGEPFIHKTRNITSEMEYDDYCYKCPFCDYTGEPCDFPDFYSEELDCELEQQEINEIYDRVNELLPSILNSIGIDRPSNYDSIVEFIVDEVVICGDSNRWNDDDIRIGFRRWLERE